MNGYPKFNPPTAGEVYFVFWGVMAAGAGVMLWGLASRILT